MNSRILEIVKNPELLNAGDIEILDREISKYPFIQSYRAVQLLATYRFQDQNYTGKLSETAAYTTDKKILYQLIHQKDIKESEEIKSETVSKNQTILEETPTTLNVKKLVAAPESKFQEIEIEPVDLPKEVYVDGELNRILFEGEENFLNEESEIIDLEATQESGEIVTLSKDGSPGEFKNDKNENLSLLNKQETLINEESENEIILEDPKEINFQEIDENITAENNLTKEISPENSAKTAANFSDSTASFTPETVVNEDKIKSEEELIESGAELSFHGETEFLPNVKIEIKKEEAMPYFKAESKISKHEAEMQKLIAEVEAKMKKSPAKTTEKEAEIINNNLNFTGISHDDSAEISPENKDSVENSEIDTDSQNTNADWKPIDLSAKKSNFRNNRNLDDPSSLISQEPEKTQSEIPVLKEEKAEIFENKPENSEKKENIIEHLGEVSNVPVFFNTWQNWLKLKPETPVLKEDNKQKAIEVFIEKEPRISKLKEESSFLVKEKGDNISHLMTETLANLYLDQKLYTKAQKAFELLIEKDPAKAEKFREKIHNIKDLKNQK